MSKTLIVSGKSSEIKVKYFPPIELNGDASDWEIGMLNFETYHAISNVSENEPVVKIISKDDPREGKVKDIFISSGFYEIHELEKIINEKITPEKIELTIDTPSLKCRVKTSCNLILSSQVKKILGFSEDLFILQKNQTYLSDISINISSINIINLDCSIASGSYVNDLKSHIIHSFFPSVPHGYKIIEVPTNVIYFPLTSSLIDTLVIRVEDQEGNLIDFGNETITVRLHLRKLSP